MPTIITHSVVAISAGVGTRFLNKSLKFWTLSLICSSLPDADVIGYHWLYVPSYHFLGHRGFFHSPFFAAILSFLVVSVFYRKEGTFSNQWWKYFLYFFILTASHGILDALTNGGNGIALLSPFSNERYFFPWTPIEVSPLSINRFLSPRGVTVLLSELLWVWLPVFLITILMKMNTKQIPKNGVVNAENQNSVQGVQSD